MRIRLSMFPALPAALVAGWAVGPGHAAAADAPASAISLELNKLEPHEKGCRAYLVADNSSATAYQALKLDLIFFRTDGIIDRRLSLDLAPLRAKKKSVKSFDLDSPACEAIGSILVNDVLECKADGVEVSDCLDRLAISSRASAQMSK